MVGELCQIVLPDSRRIIWAEVVGLKGKTVQIMPYDDMDGITVGCKVIAMGEQLSVPVSEKLLGRVLNGMGKPIDAKGDIGSSVWYPIYQSPPDVLRRPRIDQKVVTGIRSIDGIVTVGKGQRVGIFSGSGIGGGVCL